MRRSLRSKKERSSPPGGTAFSLTPHSIIRDREESQDIVQEAFTKIYLNAKKFKKQEGAQFSSWGYRILINTALSHSRSGRISRHSPGSVYQNLSQCEEV